MKIELCLAEKSYPVPGGTGETIKAVRETSISISEGEFCLVCGPSGSGKSTLLAMLGGMVYPSRGSALWDGKKTDTISNIDRIRGDKIGYAFQDTPFFKELTVMENLLLPRALGRKG